MKAKHNMPSQAYLLECFSYDQQDGTLRWKERPMSHFPTNGRMTSEHLTKIWNARLAGKMCGVLEDRGYIYVHVGGRLYCAHRIVWKMYYGTEPEQIDHRDNTPSNNRLGNLRAATHAQNCQNQSRMPKNTSGFKGVSRKRGRWRARIAREQIGTFDTPEEAHAAYCKAAQERFGEFWNPG